MKNKIVSIVFAASTLALVVSSNLNAFAEPYYGSRDRYDDDRYDDYDDRRDIERERRDLERERDRIEDERRRLEEEREEQEYEAPARVREQCPSGFSPSENKCSVEERRRGCKDMRLPGGLGCVKR